MESPRAPLRVLQSVGGPRTVWGVPDRLGSWSEVEGQDTRRGNDGNGETGLEVLVVT